MSIKGYNNQKGLGISYHATVQSAGSDKKGLTAACMGTYEVTAAAAISSVTQSVDLKQLTIAFAGAHGARKGDTLRMTTGNIIGWEFEIESIASATSVVVWSTSDTLPAAAEQAEIMRPVVQRFTQDGTTITSIDPAGLATEAKQDTQITWLNAIDDNITDSNALLTAMNGKMATLGQKTMGGSMPVVIASDQSDIPVSGPLTDAQLRASAVPVSAVSLPLPTGAATEAKQDTGNTSLSSIDGKTPALVGGRVPVDGSGVTQPISAASLPLPTGASTLAEQQAQSTLIGAVNESAPGTDTASSGLNGRLQRIAQRLTSLIALLPSALGQTTMANSLAVTIASDQSSIPVANTPQSVAGTITTARIGVGLSAVRATVSGLAPNASRKLLMIKPSKNNTGTIYIGSSGVASTTGLEIIGPDRLEFEFDAGDYYLISDTAAQEVDILEKV